MIKLTTLSSSSKGNCHILEGENSSIMIDCGIDASYIVKYIKPSKLKGVFVTHRHADHSKGVEKLSAYTSCKYYMNEESCLFVNVCGSRYKEKIFNKSVIDLEDFKVLCFDVYHDVQNTNFVILHKPSKTKILYITDTSSINNLKFVGINYFIVEGNFSKEWDLSSDKYIRTNSDVGHMPIEDTIEFLNNNICEDTKGIFISHISHSFKHYKEFEEKVKNSIKVDIPVIALNNRIISPQEFILE